MTNNEQRAIANYNTILEEFNGDKDATRKCLKNMMWLINDIEIFKNVELNEYKEIWETAYNNFS